LLGEQLAPVAAGRLQLCRPSLIGALPHRGQQLLGSTDDVVTVALELEDAAAVGFYFHRQSGGLDLGGVYTHLGIVPRLLSGNPTAPFISQLGDQLGQRRRHVDVTGRGQRALRVRIGGVLVVFEV